MNITKPKKRSAKIVEKNIIKQLSLFDYNYFKNNKTINNHQIFSMTKKQALAIEKKPVKTYAKTNTNLEISSIEESKQNLDNNSKQTSFIDLFAGIGGIKIGLENAGFKCVFSNDFDKYCKITFDYNFANNDKQNLSNHQLYFGDISQISNQQIPNAKMLAGGFPCQPFSIAGYRQGFDDQKGRGNLFFEIIRITKDKQPLAILLENVKNLQSHDQGKTLKIIYQELESLGYFITHKVLNAMEYGNIPQNRERIYIVAFKEERSFKKFQFPSKIPLTKSIADCLEKTVDKRFYYNNKPLFTRISNAIVKKNTLYQWRRKYVRENKNSLCPTLTANMGMGGHNVPIILDDFGIRKLTPKECANFQGFPDDYQLPKNLPDSALYKQFGNSVCVPVIKRIGERIREALD